MDFRKDSRSASFRNLICESFWFAFGVVPLFLYLLSPSLTSLIIAGMVAMTWGFSLPWIVRRIEARIELEADRNAALYLVEPQQLADALVKISSFGVSARKLGFTSTLSVLASTLTHPSFKERVRNLQTLISPSSSS
jgi:Zn-dependent protease with chaperone function